MVYSPKTHKYKEKDVHYVENKQSYQPFPGQGIKNRRK